MKKIVSLLVVCCLFLFCSCGANNQQSSSSPTACDINGHKGCFTCEVCGRSFLDDYKAFVDKNKSSQGLIPITGSNYYGGITYNSDYVIFITITQEVIKDTASQSFSLAYKKGYSSSKWIYYYEMNNKVTIGGEFKTIEDGYYLPYDTYSGANLSNLRSLSYKMYQLVIDELSKAFNSSGSGLIVQYFGLNV